MTVRARNRPSSIDRRRSPLQMALRARAGRRCSRCTAVVCRYRHVRRSARPSSVNTRYKRSPDRPTFTLQQDPEPAIPEPHARLAQAVPQARERILSVLVIHRRSRRRTTRQARPRADRVPALQYCMTSRCLTGFRTFWNDVLEHDLVERQVSDEALQLPVFVAEPLKLAGFPRRHPAKDFFQR